MSGLTPPVFNGSVVQCQDVVVSWSGGEYPVRVEAFYQPDPTSDWKIAGLPSEAADSNVILWQANVPAGTYAWITIIDHSGTYRQSPQGVLVESSDDDTCLETSQTASVVTQTVFMSGDGKGSEAHLSNGLDDKALLILSVCFGILAFAGLAIAVMLYSKLRQARRARMRGGARFSLVDDDCLQHQQNGDFGSRRGSAGAFNTASGLAAGHAVRGAFAAGATKDRRNEKSHIQRRQSVYDEREKGGLPSPNTSLGEHNPFLDPPLSANNEHSSPHSFNFDDNNSSIPSSNRTPTLPAGAFIGRPNMRMRSPSNADTLSSATSMQLFDIRAGGGGVLRVANDPTQIETPALSREVTRSSIVSSKGYPTSREDAETSLLPDSSRRSSADEGNSPITPSVPISNDGHSLRSSKSGRTDTTADHYASEPHSSRVWLNASRQTPK